MHNNNKMAEMFLGNCVFPIIPVLNSNRSACKHVSCWHTDHCFSW